MRAALIAILVVGGLGFAAPPVRAEPSTSNAELAWLQRRVRERLAAGDHDELDALLASLRSADARFPDGRPKLMSAYDGLVERIRWGDETGWREVRGRIEAWREARPDSPSAPVALAHWWDQYAWQALRRNRTGVAGDGGPEEYDERLARAQEVLAQSAEVAAGSPDWHYERLIVAVHSRTPRLEFERMFEEAVSSHPWFLSLWFAGAFYNLDRWSGGRPETEVYAAQAVARTRELMGDEMYARIWWVYLNREGTSVLERREVDWARIAASFQVVIEHFPDARNVNAFARFACAAGDLETLRGLLPRIGDEPLMEFWDTPAAFEDCRRRAVRVELDL